MRIESVHIKNFRSFANEFVALDAYTCLVGPNGCGKSTVLAALNVFFQERQNTSTDTALLSREDFHRQNIDDPIEIIVTFNNLSAEAKADLAHYVRHDKLIVMARAAFDQNIQGAPVQQFGIRHIYKKFSPFFELLDGGANVEQLKPIYANFRAELPELPDWKSKPLSAAALRAYEEKHPNLCEPSPSSDQFYGVARVKGKLEGFIQWIYVPAVKDASDEAEEAGNTALGKLLQRTVRQKVNFDAELETIRSQAAKQYEGVLEKYQVTLENLSKSITQRLSQLAHPNASIALAWSHDVGKSVSVNDPRARVLASEGTFKGAIPRFGHGFQRSYLLAILQELALLENNNPESTQPTLLLGCEEPELYQHPPQAKHLAEALRTLSTSNTQVIITTHSPYFISGQYFEEIRLFQKDSKNGACSHKRSTINAISARIAAITGEKPRPPNGVMAKLHDMLRPELAEIFFAPRLLLVEGQEDVAYLTAALVLDGRWAIFRKLNAQIIPVDGKSQLLRPLIVARHLGISTYIVFDADGNETNEAKKAKHQKDNISLMVACGIDAKNPFPKEAFLDNGICVWPDNIAASVEADIGKTEWTNLGNSARADFDPGESLEKNSLFIARRLQLAWEKGLKPKHLLSVCNAVLDYFGSADAHAAK